MSALRQKHKRSSVSARQGRNEEACCGEARRRRGAGREPAEVRLLVQQLGGDGDVHVVRQILLLPLRRRRGKGGEPVGGQAVRLPRHPLPAQVVLHGVHVLRLPAHHPLPAVQARL